jgi:hypothetical protein
MEATHLQTQRVWQLQFGFLPRKQTVGRVTSDGLLRPGNIHAGYKSVAILKRLVAAFRKVWPKAQIALRGDGRLALPEA